MNIPFENVTQTLNIFVLEQLKTFQYNTFPSLIPSFFAESFVRLQEVPAN